MKLTKKWAEGALKAVEELIYSYEEGFFCTGTQNCPFCIAFRKERYTESCSILNCQTCPWVVFTGETCTNAEYYNDTKLQRLNRLYGWKRKLNNIINK